MRVNKTSQTVFNLLQGEMNPRRGENPSEREDKGLSSSLGLLQFEREGVKQERAKSSRNKSRGRWSRDLSHSAPVRLNLEHCIPSPPPRSPRQNKTLIKVIREVPGRAGAEGHVLGGKAEGLGLVQAGERMALRAPSSCPHCLRGGHHETEAGPCQGCTAG